LQGLSITWDARTSYLVFKEHRLFSRDRDCRQSRSKCQGFF
jgi:hypothetical protein